MYKLDIVLVNPPMTRKEIYGVLASGGIFMPPLGLANLAAFIRKQGYSVKILDATALNLTLEQTVKNINAYKPRYIGITSTTLSINRAANLAKVLKVSSPKSKIIIGGSHVTALPKETLMIFPDFDIGVVGEGELTIIELLKALELDVAIDKIRGLVFKKHGQVIMNQPREFIEDLDTLPFPAWDLLPNVVKFYRPSCFGFKKLPTTTLVTMRGCPKRCAFCSGTDFAKSCRVHSPDYVIEMIKFLQSKYGIKDLFFQDSNFAFDNQRLTILCDLMIKNKIKLTWSCDCRIDSISPGILSLMKRAGCWSVAYGIESGSQRILDFMQKDIALKRVSEVLRWTRRAGLLTRGNFIIGYLTEDIKSMHETLSFVLKNDLDIIKITYFTPLPGSLDYRRAIKYGIIDNNYEKFNCYNIVFTPKGLGKEIINFHSRYIVRQFYLRPMIMLRYLWKSLDIKSFKLILFGFLAFLRYVFDSKKEEYR